MVPTFCPQAFHMRMSVVSFTKLIEIKYANGSEIYSKISSASSRSWKMSEIYWRVNLIVSYFLKLIGGSMSANIKSMVCTQALQTRRLRLLPCPEGNFVSLLLRRGMNEAHNLFLLVINSGPELLFYL